MHVISRLHGNATGAGGRRREHERIMAQMLKKDLVSIGNVIDKLFI